MKIVIVFAALCIAFVCGEPCKQASDCQYEHCTGDGWSESCVIGQCTCEHGTHTGSDCKSGTDCTGMHCLHGIGGNIGDRFFEKHCVDSKCRCTFHRPGGK